MSDFIKMKSSMCLALYHLERLSYMLRITNKAIYNRFKGLLPSVLLVGPHWKKQQLCWDSTGRERSQLEYHEQCYRAIMVSCSVPFPHEGACPQWIPLLSTYGTGSSTAVLPPALLALLVRWCGLQTKVMFSGVMLLEIVSFQLWGCFFYLEKCDISAELRGHGNHSSPK